MMSEKNGAESEDEGEVYELAKREGKVVVRTNRRTMITEKPNVSLNLWNLVKNSIGTVISSKLDIFNLLTWCPDISR